MEKAKREAKGKRVGRRETGWDGAGSSGKSLMEVGVGGLTVEKRNTN